MNRGVGPQRSGERRQAEASALVSAKTPAPASARSTRCSAPASVPVAVAISAGVCGRRREIGHAEPGHDAERLRQPGAGQHAGEHLRRGKGPVTGRRSWCGFAPYFCATSVQRLRSRSRWRQLLAGVAGRDLADARSPLGRRHLVVIARTFVRTAL